MTRRAIFVALSAVLLLSVVAIATGAIETASDGLYRLVGLVGQVVALVRSSWVDEVPVERLEMGALTGLVESTDPGGAWVPETDAAAYASVLERPLPAFGVVLGKRASYPFVLEVVPGSPAATAGLLPGEFIERIGGQPVRARPLWLARVLVDRAERGGGALELDAIDRFLEAKRQVVLRPAPMPAPSADVTFEKGVALVRVSRLDGLAPEKVEAGLRGYSGSAVVLDLRGVALGDSEGAVSLAATLAGGEAQVTLARRGKATEAIRARRPERAWKVFVCLDSTSAGAAELLAAALKSRGATLVGGESYGDTGQRRAQSVSGGRLWLAERWFLDAEGKPLLGTGVKPDELVRPRKEGDPVLERALELAGGQAARKAA